MKLWPALLNLVTFGRYGVVQAKHEATTRAHRRLITAVDAHLEADRRLRQRTGEADLGPAMPERPSGVRPEPPPAGRTGPWLAVSAATAVTPAITTTAAWSLVSAFGTASTGASIAALEGAAATHAIWAWFGGGALADGGGGMALGSLVFALVGLLPAFAVWVVGSRHYVDLLVDELDEEQERYLAETLEAEAATELCLRLAQRAELQQLAAARGREREG